MESFSPLTRKILAIGLLILGLFLVYRVIVSPLTNQVNESLTKLNDSRFQLSRLQQIDIRPRPEDAAVIAPETLLRGEDYQAAGQLLVPHINNLASQNGLQVDSLQLRSGSDTTFMIAADYQISGDEVNIMAFINQAERGSPTLRFRDWQISQNKNETEASQNGQSSEPQKPKYGFSGKVVAAWTKS